MNKIIVFYVKWFNINETYNLFPRCLSSYSEEITSYNVSAMSYQDVSNSIKNAHILIIDRSIFSAIRYQGHKTPSVSICDHVNSEFYKSVWELLLSQNKIKVLIASGQDLHWIEQEEGFNIYEQINGIAWFYEKPPTQKADVSPDLLDPWMKQTGCPYRSWKTIKTKVNSRFEMTHFLSTNYKSLAKIWDLCVYGVKYSTRQKVIDSMRCSDLKIITGDKISVILNYIPDRVFKNIKINFKQYTQRKILQHTKISFVCGSAYNYPVRKFFETAACGSVLLARPCLGFEDFGFRLGYNCLKIEEGSMQEQIKNIEKNNKYASELSNRLQKDIFERHNIEKRSREFIVFLKHLYNGSEIVSEFKLGEFVHQIC